MEGGIFLLLCLLALFIGTRARRSKPNLNPKAIKQKAKIKRLVLYFALVLVIAFVFLYIPFVYQEIDIAIHTRFTIENYLSIAIVTVGIVIIITTIKQLRSPI